MPAWGEDPELLETFRAEVAERLASLSAGLVGLDGEAPRAVVATLFRDAHTVKGSARMLGLTGVLAVAHGMEDLLGQLRDGRTTARRDLVDLLLVAGDAISRALPGGDLDDDDLAPVVAALGEASRGVQPAPLPVLPVADLESSGAATADLGLPQDMSQEPAAPEPRPAPAPRALVPHQATRPAGSTTTTPAHDSMRVAAGKVYDLLDVVGEVDLGARRVARTTGTLLVLSREQGRCASQLRAALLRAAVGLPPDVEHALTALLGTTEQVGSDLRDLRELVEVQRTGMSQVRVGAMGLAMVPVRRVFAALPRLVRDVAGATGKTVELLTEGEDVELDKQVLDGVADALKHLVINAVDHGCGTPAQRRAAGRPETCRVTVSARSAGGTVVLAVGDDGAGIDDDAVRRRGVELGLLPAGTTQAGAPLHQLLFVPAFSTTTEVTQTSGRGVGLDVVASSVEELGGAVEVQSAAGAGTTFTLTLPVTLGVLRCLVAVVGDERYAVPVPSVVESISLRDATVQRLAGVPLVLRAGTSLPLLDLGLALGVVRERDAPAPQAALVVRQAGGSVAWAVDRLEGESEVVVKDLGPFLGRVAHVAGATIDGDGSVVCLLDLRELAEGAAPHRRPGSEADPTAASRDGRPRVLVVEDSVGVRELERVVLQDAGYDVTTAVDGRDGVARLVGPPLDLILSDVEMPFLDGYELTRTVRRTPGWENVPVVIMTSRGEPDARQAGLDAGASAYLLKNEFDADELIRTVRRLVGT